MPPSPVEAAPAVEALQWGLVLADEDAVFLYIGGTEYTLLQWGLVLADEDANLNGFVCTGIIASLQWGLVLADEDASSRGRSS